MSDEDKATEITIKLEGEIGTSPHSREAIQDSILEMAKWEKQQLIDKAVEWLALNAQLYGGFNPGRLEDMVTNFKQSMEKK